MEGVRRARCARGVLIDGRCSSSDFAVSRKALYPVESASSPLPAKATVLRCFSDCSCPCFMKFARRGLVQMWHPTSVCVAGLVCLREPGLTVPASLRRQFALPGQGGSRVHQCRCSIVCTYVCVCLCDSVCVCDEGGHLAPCNLICTLEYTAWILFVCWFGVLPFLLLMWDRRRVAFPQVRTHIDSREGKLVLLQEVRSSSTKSISVCKVGSSKLALSVLSASFCTTGGTTAPVRWRFFLCMR